MKTFAGLKLLIFAFVLCAAPVRAEYWVEGSLGSSFLHPQILANTGFPNEVAGTSGVYYRLMIFTGESYRKTFGIGISASFYPFVEKHYSALPCVWPPTWRTREYGSKSQMYSLDVEWNWMVKQNERIHLLPLTPRIGIGFGAFLYWEGERRWTQYRPSTPPNAEPFYEPYEVVRKGNWRPLAIKGSGKIGLELLRFKEFSLFGDLQVQLQRGLTMLDYSGIVLESEVILSLSYKL
jgi:hypothetical protein